MEAGGVIRFAGAAAGDPKVVARAKRAVNRLRRLRDQPTLTNVVEASVRDDDLFVTIEPTGGRALSEILGTDGPLSPRQARALGKALSEGLAAAHRAGAVHGSLSVASIRKSEAGWVVSDFGVDYVRRCAVREHRGDQDERADVYGVGAILYEAVSGEPPFQASTDSLPSGLRAQILRCLQKKPGARYGSMDELGDALRAPGKRSAPVPKTFFWAKAFGTSAVLAALALLAWWLLQPGDPTLLARPRGLVQDGPVVTGDGKITIAVVMFEQKALYNPEHAWWARGVQLALVTAAREYDELQLLPVSAGTSLRSAREKDAQFVLRGRVVGKQDHETIEIEVLDAKTGTVRFARRAPASSEELLARSNELWAGLAQFLSLSHRDDVRQLLSHSATAYEHYVCGLVALSAGDDAGAIAEFEQAIAADENFLSVRIALIDLYARLGWNEQTRVHVQRLATIKDRGGAWGRLHAQRVGPDAAQRSAALETIVAREPQDAAWRLQLAGAYRATSRWGECMEQAKVAGRSQEHVKRAAYFIAQCGMAAGEAASALDIVGELSEGFADDADLHELTGDTLLQLGRYGDARASYREARRYGSPNILSKLALVGVIADGRCGGALGTMALVSKKTGENQSPEQREIIARVWQTAATICDDRAAVNQLIVWARENLGKSPLRDEIEFGRKLQLGGSDSARAKGLIDGASGSHRPSYVMRYSLYLRNARKGKNSEDALAHLPSAEPLDRYSLFGFPLMYEVALTRLDAGDSEGAEQACNELVAGASAYAPGMYCLARVAEAKKEFARAATHYRAFLDRWFDGFPENSLVRDARDRLKAVRQAMSARRTGS